jgi:uncharacterized protein YkwD
MQHNNTMSLWAGTLVATLSLAGCGGGGGGDSSSSTSTTTTTTTTTSTTSTTITGTVSTTQYAASSAQLEMFTLINAERQQCGIPTLSENTLLDTASYHHALYMGDNSVVTDSETSGNNGYTGTSYETRAQAVGFPTDISVGGVSAGYYTNSTLTETAYGQNLVDSWLSGVYHSAITVWPVTLIGVGEYETTYNGSPEAWGTVSLANYTAIYTSGTPVAFPCNGVTGVPYAGTGESPTPPNTSGSWGTPIVLSGNPTDTLVLTSGTITPAGGSAITLQILNSSTDPNKEIQAYEAAAYSASPLQPNTSYTYVINGTINGTAFTKTATFTTGSTEG